MKKNHYEENLFAFEDKRYEIDMIIEIFQYAITSFDSLCTKKTTELIVNQMISEADRHYSEIMARLALPQKELLYAVAREHRARQITSGAFIRRHSLKSASSVQSSIKKLLSYGLVSFDSGDYFVADQLMRLWLQK